MRPPKRLTVVWLHAHDRWTYNCRCVFRFLEKCAHVRWSSNEVHICDSYRIVPDCWRHPNRAKPLLLSTKVSQLHTQLSRRPLLSLVPIPIFHVKQNEYWKSPNFDLSAVKMDVNVNECAHCCCYVTTLYWNTIRFYILIISLCDNPIVQYGTIWEIFGKYDAMRRPNSKTEKQTEKKKSNGLYLGKQNLTIRLTAWKLNAGFLCVENGENGWNSATTHAVKFISSVWQSGKINRLRPVCASNKIGNSSNSNEKKVNDKQSQVSVWLCSVCIMCVYLSVLYM